MTHSDSCALMAVHIPSGEAGEAKIRRLRICMDSIDGQRTPDGTPIDFAKFASVSCEAEHCPPSLVSLLTRNEKDWYFFVQQGGRSSQFEHYALLAHEIPRIKSRYAKAVVLFSDADDLWSPQRLFTALNARHNFRMQNPKLDTFPMVAHAKPTGDEIPEDELRPDRVNGLLEAGRLELKDIGPMEQLHPHNAAGRMEYWMFTTTLPRLERFVVQVNDAVLQSRCCDLVFRNFLFSVCSTQSLLFEGGMACVRSAPSYEDPSNPDWNYLYNTPCRDHATRRSSALHASFSTGSPDSESPEGRLAMAFGMLVMISGVEEVQSSFWTRFARSGVSMYETAALWVCRHTGGFGHLGLSPQWISTNLEANYLGRILRISFEARLSDLFSEADWTFMEMFALVMLYRACVQFERLTEQLAVTRTLFMQRAQAVAAGSFAEHEAFFDHVATGE